MRGREEGRERGEEGGREGREGGKEGEEGGREGREGGKEGEEGGRERREGGGREYNVSHCQILVAVTVLEFCWRSEYLQTPAHTNLHIHCACAKSRR